MLANETARTTLLDFHAASHAKDLAALDDLLADQVIAAGPGLPAGMVDRAQATAMLARWLACYDELRHEPLIGGPARAVLPFTAQMRTGRVRGAYVLRTGEAGAILELEVLLDPVTARLVAADTGD